MAVCGSENIEFSALLWKTYLELMIKRIDSRVWSQRSSILVNYGWMNLRRQLGNRTSMFSIVLTFYFRFILPWSEEVWFMFWALILPLTRLISSLLPNLQTLQHYPVLPTDSFRRWQLSIHDVGRRLLLFLFI
jgi:hypothetical protein